MVNTHSISLTGKLSCWMTYNELGNFCNDISKNIPCKIVLVNSKTNFLVNPKSLLNTLSLNLNSGDDIEVVLTASSEYELDSCVNKIKNIFKAYANLC